MSKFLTFDEFMSLKIVLILANSADPNEMPHYVAFHLGFYSWFFTDCACPN